MTTEYEVRLDRDACDGIFACLVRDERFVEATDGLATIGEATEESTRDDRAVVARFDDDRLGQAEQAATACPVGAIDVTEVCSEGTDE